MESGVLNLYLKLSETLEEMTKLYRQLLEVVRLEKQTLIDVNLSEIENARHQKEIFIDKIRIYDLMREKYAQNLGAAMGINSTSPRLLELARMMPLEEGDHLRQLHSSLEMLIKRIQELNRENETYAQSALKALNGALGNIKETLSGKKTYQRKGQYQSGPDNSGHFVSKEA